MFIRSSKCRSLTRIALAAGSYRRTMHTIQCSVKLLLEVCSACSSPILRAQVNVSVLLMIRTYALYNRSRRLMIGFIILGLALFSVGTRPLSGGRLLIHVSHEGYTSCSEHQHASRSYNSSFAKIARLRPFYIEATVMCLLPPA